MAARRPGYRQGFNRWDRRDVGLKPENALSRVAQLIEVGEVEDANRALYDIITDNQTRRRQWSKTYEGIMLKLMELSVKLRESGMVKEALHKYRAMCMQSNVASLEEVVRFLVDLAEKRTEEARKHVDETILEGAEDLEDSAMETPETLILEASGNALTKERIDRQQVVPWMRFLWEVYRVVLDIVKTHNKLEVCYHGMANRAFEFCIKYKRFMEFRRLCDMLRQHLTQLMTNPRVSPNDVKISDADTLQKFMETRFIQLSTAVKLEHWQQAYRTIEDIHTIMSLGKTKAKPQHMSVYYDKLMQVFWVSGNYLYHAHALYKLYTLSIKQNRKLSADDARNMASRLLLASLSIPVYDAQSSVLSDSYGVLSDVLGSPTNDNNIRHARMASLLGYSSAAERGPLISELLTKGVREAAHPELYDVYDILEGEMAPLQFADRFKKILAFVESNELLKDYTVPLRRVGIFRLLEQLGRVYDVMRLEDMKRVASFTDYTEVEETALTALKTRSLAVRFDYQNQCLRFESELFSSDGMRKQLGRLAKRMAQTAKMLSENAQLAGQSAVDSEVVAVALEKEKKAAMRRQLAMAKARDEAESEAKEILRRGDIIERRKEEAERRTAEAVKQRKLAAARELVLKEARRKKEEQLRLEQQKIPKPAAPPFGLGAGSGLGGPVGLPGMDTPMPGEEERQAQLTKQKEEELRQQAEFKKKIAQTSVHLNHVERSLREEQWPLLEEAHIKESTQQSELMEEIAAKELEEAQSQHARALEDKGRTMRMMPALETYLSDLMQRADEDFELWAQRERERAEAQAVKEAEISRQRAEEEELRRKALEEEEERAREEAEIKEREAREVEEKREAEEKQRKEELEAAQRAEEAERERKAAAAAAAAAAAKAAAPPASSRVPATMATGNGPADRPPAKPAPGKYRPGMFRGFGKGLESGDAPPASSRPPVGTGSAGGGFGPAGRTSYARSSSLDSSAPPSTNKFQPSYPPSRPSSFGPAKTSSSPGFGSASSTAAPGAEKPKTGGYVPPHLRNKDSSGSVSFGSRPPSNDAPPPGPRPLGSSFGPRRSGAGDMPPGPRRMDSAGSGGFGANKYSPTKTPSSSSSGTGERQRPRFYNSKLQKPPSDS